jgi:CHAT domain-containing protein
MKTRLQKYQSLIDQIFAQLPKVEQRKAEAQIKYRLQKPYPFAHPWDWAAFTASGV